MITAKVISQHIPECYAVKNTDLGKWETPWAYFNGEAEYRDLIGRKRSKGGAHYRWLVARCNCSPCTATVLVRENDLLKLLPVSP